ncbi:hypothetical protein GLOIN_2v927853 [Rhizophagus clarus]|uniref:Uncharacterized protein n=1 Tax=Rhizophagus clarus TaxID=94130 RepID=A0A8H3QQ34_9GLOM|nr:hypothetical protein GLOIN_2v927853 [Rhizophagus clarus]
MSLTNTLRWKFGLSKITSTMRRLYGMLVLKPGFLSRSTCRNPTTLFRIRFPEESVLLHMSSLRTDDKPTDFHENPETNHQNGSCKGNTHSSLPRRPPDHASHLGRDDRKVELVNDSQKITQTKSPKSDTRIQKNSTPKDYPDSQTSLTYREDHSYRKCGIPSKTPLKYIITGQEQRYKDSGMKRKNHLIRRELTTTQLVDPRTSEMERQELNTRETRIGCVHRRLEQRLECESK